MNFRLMFFFVLSISIVLSFNVGQKAAAAVPKANQSQSITSSAKKFKVGSATVQANVVTVDLNKGKFNFKIGLANNKVGSVEDLASIAKRNNAKVAINASFFNAYTDSSYKQPYGLVFVNGEELISGSGDKRAVFAIDEDNNVSIHGGEAFREIMYDKKYKGAIQAGPTLVNGGRISLDPLSEGHRDPKILTNGGARSAIGITSNNKLILVTTKGATIPQLAEVMKLLGAYDAMNLDGGASSCLYYNGKYITQPGRKISNAILITE
ncbi:phosphodiester glycosidase family protein [Schinkia sp. CFF1]